MTFVHLTDIKYDFVHFTDIKYDFVHFTDIKYDFVHFTDIKYDFVHFTDIKYDFCALDWYKIWLLCSREGDGTVYILVKQCEIFKEINCNAILHFLHLFAITYCFPFLMKKKP